MNPEEEARKTIHRFFNSMDTQNLKAMQKLIPKTDSTVHIGTDDGEIWKGYDVLNKATKEQFEGLEHYKADVYDLTINVSDSGKVAWYFHLLDAEIKSSGSIIRWEGARFTGVLQKIDGQWVMAQTHVSNPTSS